MRMEVSSSAFEQGRPIPSKYTCDGENISPPLEWSHVPKGTKSIALICDDPDAPGGTFVHWVLYNLPPETRDLPEDLTRQPSVSDGTRQGMADFGRLGYAGPCPPSGTHRYFFRVYALDALVDPARPGLTRDQILKAIEGHILAEGQLMGTYQRRQDR